MQAAMFNPQPYDLTSVPLPQVLEKITEQISHNHHEVWAKHRISQGWSWGPMFNHEEKLHPSLQPYNSLDEAQLMVNRITSSNILKSVLTLEYQLDSADVNIDKALAWRFGDHTNSSSPLPTSEQKVSFASVGDGAGEGKNEQTQNKETQYVTYTPRPMPTPTKLPREYTQSVELVASCCHDLWARQKLDAGFSFGHTTDAEHMRHNCLIPYEYLPVAERQLLKKSVRTVLQVLLWCGFRLLAPRRSNDAYQLAIHSLETADGISKAAQRAHEFDTESSANDLEDFEDKVERRLHHLEQQTAAFGNKIDKVLEALERLGVGTAVDKWQSHDHSDSEEDETAGNIEHINGDGCSPLAESVQCVDPRRLTKRKCQSPRHRDRNKHKHDGHHNHKRHEHNHKHHERNHKHNHRSSNATAASKPKDLQIKTTAVKAHGKPDERDKGSAAV